MKIYNRDFPEVDELVVVTITKVDDYLLMVKLIEYEDREGLILRREISRKKSDSVSKLMKIGKQDVMRVLRIDKEHIDLTKKNITQQDIDNKLQHFSKSKKIYNMITYISEKFSIDINFILEKLVWNQHTEDDENYIHPFDKIKNLIDDNYFSTLGLEPDAEKALIREILLRIPIQELKVEALIDVCCFTEHGIDAIKSALIAGKTEKIEIKLNKSPTYRLYTVSENLLEAENLINESIMKITEEINKYGGFCTIKQQPTCL